MARFHIKLGRTAKEAQILVNGRPMLNVVGLSIKQGPEGEPQVQVTIPATEIELECEGELRFARGGPSLSILSGNDRAADELPTPAGRSAGRRREGD